MQIMPKMASCIHWISLLGALVSPESNLLLIIWVKIINYPRYLQTETGSKVTKAI